MIFPSDNSTKTTSGEWQAVYSEVRGARCGENILHLLATPALPCDAWHHYYHYQSSAQYLRLAETCVLLGKREEALAAYDKAIFQDHLNEAAIEERKNVAGCQLPVAANYNKHPLLDAEFCLSIGEEPDALSERHDEAAGYFLAGDYASALALLPADADHSNSRFLRGKCLFHLREYEKARGEFAEAVRLSHIRHDAYHRFASQQHVLRGERLFREGQIDLAVADFTKALDLHGGNKDALKARAEAYIAKGNLRLAQADESALA